MARKVKSNLEFGDLFDPRSLRRVFTVSQITSGIKALLEAHYPKVWVEGEVSNLRLQASGHSYFTLKDAGAQLSCVLFRGDAAPAARERLTDGQRVTLEGELTVYETRGHYQLIVRSIEWQGVGALQLAFERLKQKLNAEGLFDSARKRLLPRFPQRVGVVTSPTGAALQDVLHVLRRRCRAIELVLAPCRVQGEGAGAEIAGSIRLLNSAVENGTTSLDAILLTRGGGSLEDLWAFNEEVVARAIVGSGVPIVSAVGHEIDFTISDFAADIRAATPSAAAEILSEGYVASWDLVGEANEILKRPCCRRLAEEREVSLGLLRRLMRAHPRGVWRENAQRVDEVIHDLKTSARRTAEALAGNFLFALKSFRSQRVRERVEDLRDQLRDHRVSLATVLRRSLDSRREQARALAQRLNLLSPMNVLDRGYSITKRARDSRVIRSVSELEQGETIQTRVADGEFVSQVVAGKQKRRGRPRLSNLD